jgi:N-methylhydantoinase B
MRLDGVTIEILKNRFQGIVSEMGQTVLHTGHTVFIKETADFGAMLVTPKGEVFAAPLNIGVTVLIGKPMDDAIRAITEYREGDICIANDPDGTGGMATHLPDLFVWKPVFWEGELVCFAWTFIHASDVGGKVPGSISPSSYDLFQEGMILPPTKLFDRGQVVQPVLDIILSNCRIPDQNWGDLKSLVAALNTGERRLHEMIRRYGIDVLRDGMEDVLEYAERQTRRIIRDIPDGDYEFSDYMEGEVAGLGVIRIKLKMTVRGDEILLDFTGTDPQVPAALNMPTKSKNGHWMIVPALVKYFKSVEPNLTYNSGMVRPVKVEIPRGTLLNPEPHAASGVRAATMFRVFDVVSGALAQAVPHQVPAAGSGQGCIVLVSLLDVDTGQNKISVVQPLCGGCGGRPMKDGLDGVDFSLGSLRNVPTESLEREMPLLIQKYAVRPDSAGAGKHRGGSGVELVVRCYTPNTVVTARGMERYRFRPWGLFGGRAGTTGFTQLRRVDGKTEDIGQIDVLFLNPGDELHFGAQGGGGYGDPLEREPALVLDDVRNEILSPEAAERVYGVVVREGQIDEAATKAARAAAPTAAAPGWVDFGPERAAYDASWTPAHQDALASLLEALPPSLRHFFRVRVAERAQARLARGASVDRAALHEILESLRGELRVESAAARR